jgi:hypothetical protein
MRMMMLHEVQLLHACNEQRTKGKGSTFCVRCSHLLAACGSSVCAVDALFMYESLDAISSVEVLVAASWFVLWQPARCSCSCLMGQGGASCSACCTVSLQLVGVSEA